MPQPGRRPLLREGKFDGEGGSNGWNTGDFDRAAMAFNEAFNDGEAKTGATAFAGAGLIDAVEAFEEVGQGGFRDANAMVDDFYHCGFFILFQLDPQVAAFGIVLYGVG